jgi:hypothetical protein
MRGRPARWIRALRTGILLAAAGAVPPAVADHGGTLQVNEQAGPFALTVWTLPARPRTDDCQVGVVVMHQDRLRSVPDARVRLHARHADGGAPPVSVAATHGQGPLYEAALVLPSAGRWTVTVEVSSPAGTGSVDFPLTVEGASWRQAWPLAVPFVPLALLAAWLAWRRRARAAAAAPRPAGP